MIRSFLVIACLAWAGCLQAAEPASALTLDPIYGDHMVVQRGRPVVFAGSAAPGSAISCGWHGATTTATADAAGRWSVSLPPLEEGAAAELTVTQGATTLRVTDILAGDVWLCSGQSNMAWSVGKSADAPAEIAAADHPRIRLLSMPQTLAFSPRSVSAPTSWKVCSPTTVAGFSAAGYYFARELRKRVDVPIGLVNASWGGTPIQGWMSRPSLDALGLYRDQLILGDRLIGRPEEGDRVFAEQVSAWWAQVDPAMADPAQPWYGPVAPGSWQAIRVPGPWEERGLPKFDGIAYLRVVFDAPPGMAGEACSLALGRVDDWDTTWINGREIGAGFAFSEQRTYAIPAGVLKPTGNVLAIRVYDFGMGGGLLDVPRLVRGSTAIPIDQGWTVRTARPKEGMPDHPLRIDRNIRHPTLLYNGLIAPLGALPLRGVLWYQGESNAGESELYRRLLPAMIQDWRKQFAVPDLPFGIVQLANRQAVQAVPVQNGWASIRDAQRSVARTVPHCGLIVTIDIGEADNIHPANKQDVGRRLASWAWSEVYRLPDAPAPGPRMLGHAVSGGAVRVSFSGAPLRIREDALVGFAVAGEDRVWRSATATIDGMAVVVSSPAVPRPVAVRYAWANNPVATLVDAQGLPCEPFRTDDW